MFPNWNTLSSKTCLNIVCLGKILKKKRGAPKSERSLQKELLFEKYRSKLIVNKKLLPSNHEIYQKIASKLEVKSKQTIYLHVKRYFGVIATNEHSKDLSSDDSEEDDHVFNLNIENDEFIQKYMQTNAYLRGIRSYFRMIIWSCSRYNCYWNFNVFCLKDDQIICSGICKDPGCPGKVSLNTNNGRRILRICLKNYNPNIVHTKKSYTTGAHKERIQKLLSQNTPYVTRSLFAAEILEEG